MNEKFLTLYQQIESEIKENYPEIIVPVQNVVSSLSSLEQFKGREDLLMAMKNIRNILSHCKQINGQPIILVNECLLKSAEQILKELKEPYFVEYDKKYKTLTLDTKIKDIIKHLKTKRTIPVLNSEKQVLGVLFVDVLPEILCSKKYTEAATLKDFKRLLGLEDYVFIKPEVSKKDLREIVEQNKTLGQPVKGFILTVDGTNKSKFTSFISLEDVYF